VVGDVNATILGGVKNHHGLRIKDGGQKPEVAFTATKSIVNTIIESNSKSKAHTCRKLKVKLKPQTYFQRH